MQKILELQRSWNFDVVKTVLPSIQGKDQSKVAGASEASHASYASYVCCSLLVSSGAPAGRGRRTSACILAQARDGHSAAR